MNHPNAPALAPYGILFDNFEEPSVETLSEPDVTDPVLTTTTAEEDIIRAREEREARKLETEREREAWLAEAKVVIMALAADGRVVSGNNVWPLMPAAPGGNGRVLSQAFRDLVAVGVIQPIGWTRSHRGHGTRIRLYEAA